jgi:hypothetical protein
MKLNKLIFIVLFFGVVFNSCELPIGLWPDNIRLPIRKASFKPTGDSITIKTGGKGWWIADVKVNNQIVRNPNPPNSDSMFYKVNVDSILVERRSNNILFIKASANKYKPQRNISVCLENGDYFDYVEITQKGQ